MAEIRVELRDFTDNILGNLDITSSDDFPLSLNFQNFDVRDFNSRSGSFSKTFRVPATKNNNKLFNHIYKDGNIDRKNVLKDLPSTIYADHLPIIRGKLRVSQIFKNTDVLEYECLFLGDNMDWADEIKNLDLDELRFSSSSIANDTWTFDNPRTTYPDFESDKDNLVYPLLTVGEGDSELDNTLDSDFVPCVYVKNVWDKIFEAQGYRVSSTFCESDLFKNLIMPLIFQKPKDVVDVSFGKVLSSLDEELIEFDFASTGIKNSQRSIENQNYNFSSAAGTNNVSIGGFSLPFIVSADTLTDAAPFQQGEDTDDYGNAQLGTEHAGGFKNGLVVSAQGSGVFEMSGSVTVEVESDGAMSAGSIFNFTSYKIKASIVKLNSSNADSLDFVNVASDTSESHTISHINASTNEHTFNFTPNTVEASQGDKFALRVDFIHNSSIIYTNLGQITERPKLKFRTKAQSYLQIEQTGAFFNGETISNIHQMLPKGKQSDFVKGIAQMFNLQFETNPISKIVTVEPYDYFYEGFSNAIDWTDKIDYSKNIKDEFIYDIKSNIIFKYKDASGDGLLEKYNKRNTLDWGAYEENDRSGKFQTGEYKVENSYFSPTFNWYEPNYIFVNHIERSPLIPMYFSEDSDLSITNAIERPEKEFEIGARILIKGGGRYSSFNGKAQWQYYDVDNISGGAQQAYATWNKSSFIAFDNLVSSIGGDTPAIHTLSQATISDGHQIVDYNLSFSDIIHDTILPEAQFVSNIDTQFQEGVSFAESVSIPEGRNYSPQVETVYSLQRLRGLFYNYYSKMVNQLKQNPRLKVVYLNLTSSDIAQLDFRKLIFIDGSYYRLNKIIDFKPHDKQSTKVELQEYFVLGKSTNPNAVEIDIENLNM